MLLIKKNNTNKCIYTALEKQVGGATHYLFEFTKHDSNKKYYVLCTDVSTYTYHHNKSLIVEKTSPNNLAGEIELPVGDYDYTIYAKNSIDLTVNNSIVEQSLASVIDVEVPENTFNETIGEEAVFNG